MKNPIRCSMMEKLLSVIGLDSRARNFNAAMSASRYCRTFISGYGKIQGDKNGGRSACQEGERIRHCGKKERIDTYE